MLLIAIIISLILIYDRNSKKVEEPININIAIPYEEEFLDINTSYYKSWLEEHSDLSIHFEFIPENYVEEYLNILSNTSDTKVDAILFSPQTSPSIELITKLGVEGKILELNEWIQAESDHLKQYYQSFEDYDLEQSITAKDGNIYYMPSVYSSTIGYYLQKFYINISWLEELGLSIPTTAEEFENVLTEFSERKPDKIPMIGSMEQENTFVLNYLMNAFVQCNPENYYFAKEDGTVFFAPTTSEWREGLTFCRDLYDQGLLLPQNFTYTTEQLIGIVNDPQELVGSFTSNEICDVMSENSSDLLSKYLFISPLKGDEEIQYSIPVTKLPTVGGIVIAESKYPNEILELMDIMLSEEAFLIGHYGELNVDWEYAKQGDIGFNGEPALITIKNKDWLHNKKISLSGFGPFMTSSKYADNIMWERFQTNQTEYFEARASKVYQQFNPIQQLTPIELCQHFYENEELFRSISQYVKASMVAFVAGEIDITNDEDWKHYLTQLDELGISFNLEQVKKHYDKEDGCDG